MKKILFKLIFFAGMLMIYSCKTDNYDAPDATLQGTIMDESGVGLQLEQGSGSVRLRLDELSWSETPIPIHLNFKQDGSYINTKVFPGTYLVTPIDGPFYPITGDTVVVKGTTTHDFQVVPYLTVDWVDEPRVTPGGEVAATFKFTRNGSPAGETMPNLLDYQLFISTTKYVGNNNFDGTVVGAVVPVTNDMENQNITISSAVPMKYATTYYVRIGVRVNDSFKKYNYTDIKTVTVTDDL